jgi:hypothetical protein
VTADAGVTFIYTTDKYCNSSAPGGCTSGGVKKHGDIDGGQSSVGQPTGAAAGSWGLVGSPLTAQTLDPDPNSLTSILIYVDRDVIPCYPDGNTTLDIGGNGGFYFATGTIIYAPCSHVRLHGNSDPPSHGGAVVAWQMTVSGTKSIDLGGPSIGVDPEPQSNLVQ